MKTRAFYVALPREFPLSVPSTFEQELQIFTHKFTPLSTPRPADHKKSKTAPADEIRRNIVRNKDNISCRIARALSMQIAQFPLCKKECHYSVERKEQQNIWFMSRHRPLNLGFCILPPKVALDTPFLGCLCTDLAETLVDF